MMDILFIIGLAVYLFQILTVVYMLDKGILVSKRQITTFAIPGLPYIIAGLMCFRKLIKRGKK